MRDILISRDNPCTSEPEFRATEFCQPSGVFGKIVG